MTQKTLFTVARQINENKISLKTIALENDITLEDVMEVHELDLAPISFR